MSQRQKLLVLGVRGRRARECAWSVRAPRQISSSDGADKLSGAGQPGGLSPGSADSSGGPRPDVTGPDPVKPGFAPARCTWEAQLLTGRSCRIRASRRLPDVPEAGFAAASIAVLPCRGRAAPRLLLRPKWAARYAVSSPFVTRRGRAAPRFPSLSQRRAAELRPSRRYHNVAAGDPLPRLEL
ncbi:uncharacterized protein LOC125945657 [Dermacentor silvarum]|uniref:uncharacterized protein LOC125945657 n=1 Tax=Dermacentor silvarum TaxID=543639 RepID=UPI002100E68C|nr:uncharacterized protein LOC125945657 [Dermacentor silvarum]